VADDGGHREEAGGMARGELLPARERAHAE
jgi:hypothetical protein